MNLNFFIDRGGTFTDIYCQVIKDSQVVGHKILKLLSVDKTYPDGPSEGIRRIVS